MTFELTPDQATALDHIKEFFAEEGTHTFSLLGSAGTGKTTIIDVVKTFAPGLAVAAPTHKAKEVISAKTGILNAFTVAELIGLGVDTDVTNFDPNKPEFKPKNTPKLENIRRIAIDESSMINSMLYERLVDLAEDYNTKILFIGDPCQLPPVKEQSDSLSLTATEKQYELTQVVRQTSDNPLTYLLLALRNDIKYRTHGVVDTDTLRQFITSVKHLWPTVDVESIKQNQTSLFKWCLQYMGDEHMTEAGLGWTRVTTESEFKEVIREHSSIDDMKTIAYTNAAVSEYNLMIRKQVFPGAQVPVVKGDRMMAYRSVKDATGRNFILTNSVEYKVLAVGNEELHSNGAIITTYRVEMVSERGQRASCNILAPSGEKSFNAVMSNLYYAVKNAPFSEKSRRWVDYFKVRDQALALTNHAEVYNNQALPYKSIDYGYAITDHKSQGSTYRIVLVDGNNLATVKYSAKDLSPDDRAIYLLKLIYVALSRASEKAIFYFK